MGPIVTHITAWLLLLMGVSVLLNPKGWQAMLADMMSAPHRAMPLFLFFLFFGLFIVTQHNIWHGKGLVISLVGWVTVIKSVVFLSAPQLAGKFDKFTWLERRPLMRGIGLLWVVVASWLLFV